MREIKTIAYKMDSNCRFDADVNKAIREGWELMKRGVLAPYAADGVVFGRMLIAEMEREVTDRAGDV